MKLKERDYLGDLSVNGKISEKILEKWDAIMTINR
jgi:hypothetical protein